MIALGDVTGRVVALDDRAIATVRTRPLLDGDRLADLHGIDLLWCNRGDRLKHVNASDGFLERGLDRSIYIVGFRAVKRSTPLQYLAMYDWYSSLIGLTPQDIQMHPRDRDRVETRVGRPTLADVAVVGLLSTTVGAGIWYARPRVS